MKPTKTWRVRVKLGDMRSKGECFVFHSEFNLEVPGTDAGNAAELLRRALQRVVNIEANTTDLWGG
jgi:hypothetical protein